MVKPTRLLSLSLSLPLCFALSLPLVYRVAQSPRLFPSLFHIISLSVSSFSYSLARFVLFLFFVSRISLFHYEWSFTVSPSSYLCVPVQHKSSPLLTYMLRVSIVCDPTCGKFTLWKREGQRQSYRKWSTKCAYGRVFDHSVSDICNKATRYISYSCIASHANYICS